MVYGLSVSVLAEVRYPQSLLQERSRSGNTVGKAGRRGHSFDSFAEQDFTFTELTVGSYQGLRVQNFNFTSTLPAHNASLAVMAYMFEESGNITFGNETSEMRKGMLKFNIQVTSKFLFEVYLACSDTHYLPLFFSHSFSSASFHFLATPFYIRKDFGFLFIGWQLN